MHRGLSRRVTTLEQIAEETMLRQMAEHLAAELDLDVAQEGGLRARSQAHDLTVDGLAGFQAPNRPGLQPIATLADHLHALTIVRHAAHERDVFGLVARRPDR